MFKRINSIEGLRGYAIIFVIFFHIFNKILSGGFLGIDLFFVISGYLISKKIIDHEKNNIKFNFLEFYFSRMRKILPPLIIIYIFSFILGYFLLISN